MRRLMIGASALALLLAFVAPSPAMAGEKTSTQIGKGGPGHHKGGKGHKKHGKKHGKKKHGHKKGNKGGKGGKGHKGR